MALGHGVGGRVGVEAPVCVVGVDAEPPVDVCAVDILVSMKVVVFDVELRPRVAQCGIFAPGVARISLHGFRLVGKVLEEEAQGIVAVVV